MNVEERAALRREHAQPWVDEIHAECLKLRSALLPKSALGEAVMIQMVSGAKTFTPKPIDGWIFFFEPLRTLASSIVDYHEGIGAPAST